MSRDHFGSPIEPLTVGDLVDLLEAIHDNAEVRVAVLDPIAQQYAVLGVRTTFRIRRADTDPNENLVWIVAGPLLGLLPNS